MTNAPTLREAAEALVAKLNECEPHISAAFLIRHQRLGDYTGPNFAGELATLKAALSAQVPEDEATAELRRLVALDDEANTKRKSA